MRRRLLTLLAAGLLALGAPTAALAQSAGDEQYEDPLAGSEPEQSAPSSGSQGSTPPPAAAQPAPAAATAQVPPPAATAEQLPRTGGREAVLAAAGALLLAGGLGLRRGTRSA